MALINRNSFENSLFKIFKNRLHLKILNISGISELTKFDVNLIHGFKNLATNNRGIVRDRQEQTLSWDEK